MHVLNAVLLYFKKELLPRRQPHLLIFLYVCVRVCLFSTTTHSVQIVSTMA